MQIDVASGARVSTRVDGGAPTLHLHSLACDRYFMPTFVSPLYKEYAGCQQANIAHPDSDLSNIMPMSRSTYAQRGCMHARSLCAHLPTSLSAVAHFQGKKQACFDCSCLQPHHSSLGLVPPLAPVATCISSSEQRKLIVSYGSSWKMQLFPETWRKTHSAVGPIGTCAQWAASLLLHQYVWLVSARECSNVPLQKHDAVRQPAPPACMTPLDAVLLYRAAKHQVDQCKRAQLTCARDPTKR